MSVIRVSMTPREASDRIESYVLKEGISTECIGRYSNASPDGREMHLLVFEKYFMRNSSRASLSVSVDNLTGTTCVYSVGSGGGQGALLNFDWGAADSFSSLVEKALRGYVI